MTDSKEKRAAEIQDSIRQIFYHEWDPIGVSGSAPEDEYDSYIGPVYRILSGSRSEEELIEFLFRTERETIGMSGGSPEFLQSIARRLLQLDVIL
jgi:hypothetical protein